MWSFAVHGEGGRLVVRVPSLTDQDIQQLKADCWLSCDVEVVAAEFYARVRLALMAEELVDFAAALAPMYDSLKGSAELDSLERQLTLRVEVYPNGGVGVRGVLRSGINPDISLTFQFPSDQTYLREPCRDLEHLAALSSRWRGRPAVEPA